ncbi:MAG TPA: 2'-5' RNA ligase family protein, partial [Bryobacteraceae bacterium]|nr:2'-5' RNA ligase family protein [Bryobacteraceae bacterium]
MQATVSLLDARHSKIVKDLWAELNDRFGVRGIYVTPFPHMSYHVADSYDLQSFQPALAAIAADAHPIQIHTSGLGVFTGGRPILYVPVVRSPELTELHRRILSVA